MTEQRISGRGNGKRSADELKKGVVLDLEILNLTPQAQGRALVDGFVIFVNGCLPGELCRARITLRKRRYAVAEVLEILQTSPLRQEPFCAVYGFCGGCSLQHLRQEEQLRTKAQGVRSLLERIGKQDLTGVPMSLHPFEPGSFGDPHPMAYRCKVQYAISQKREGIRLGFYARGSHDVVETENCGIQPAPMNLLCKAAEELWTKAGLSVYDEETGEGLLRRLLLRASWSEKTILATVVINGTELPKLPELIEAWGAALSESGWHLSGVYLNEHTTQNNRVSGATWRHVWGETLLSENLAGLSFRLHPAAFFQVNPVMAERLFLHLGDLVIQTGAKKILDLYCGGGALGLAALAKLRAESKDEDVQLEGIEIVPEAVADAQANAKRNGFEYQANFICAPAEDVLREHSRRDFEILAADLAIVDPPRKGCAPELIDAIAQAKVPKLIYVSCHPATLARDIARLSEYGYELRDIAVFDMFPETEHVETVVLMSRVDD